MRQERSEESLTVKRAEAVRSVGRTSHQTASAHVQSAILHYVSPAAFARGETPFRRTAGFWIASRGAARNGRAKVVATNGVRGAYSCATIRITNPMRLPWLKLIAALALVWLVAGSVIFFARRAKVTPETVASYVATHPIEGKPAAERAKIVEKLAGQMNQLAYEDRRGVRMGKGLDGFFRALTPEEQARFLDLTLPTGFKQMMEALNKMTPEKRQSFVTKALDDMKKREGERPPDEQLDANARKIMDQGFKTFYSEASAEVKMDVAPLIEQLQKNLQDRR